MESRRVRSYRWPGRSWAQRCVLAAIIVSLLLGSCTPAAPTATPRPPTATSVPPRSIPDVVAQLEGLPIDTFFEESYRQLQLRDPDGLVYDGLADEYGIANDQFTNMSDAYVRETQQLEVAILDLLRTYDRDSLTPEQQLSYDIYAWWLDDRVRGHEFMYYNYPVNSMSIWGAQTALIDFMVNYHPINSRKDAEDYITRLSQLDTWTAQLIEGLKLRQEAGVVPPRYIIQDSIVQINDHLAIQGAGQTGPEGIAQGSDPRPTAGPGRPNPAQIVLYTSFRDKLDQLDTLSAEEKQALLDAALAEVEGTFVPAFLELNEYLSELETIATDDVGAWKLPNGDAYYAYALRSEANTDLTPDEVHELGLAEVARIQAEMREAAAELEHDYPGEISMEQLNQHLGVYSEYFSGEALRAEYERLIAEADRATAAVFDVRPSTGVTVEQEPYGAPVAYYQLPALDGSRPGAFFINLSSPTPHYRMPTTTYHETIPGHHFQVALAREMDLPMFRRALVFNAYVEGWALYAERLAWEMGLYEGDPLGNLGRLQYELLRAARLVVDTGIHAKGWTWQKGATYFANVLGWTHGKDAMVRYIIFPGQASGYMIGMLKILELRQRAMDALGDQFDLKEFHNVILGQGSMPLEILERVVDDWIADKAAVPVEASSVPVEASSVPVEASSVPVFEPGDCRFEVPAGYRVECGDLIVPEDRHQPHGRTIRLHVAIFRCTGPDPQPDPVIHLMGGPGASPLDVAAHVLRAGGDAMLQKRDLIIFSQRGTRGAEPFLRCPGYTEFRWELAGQPMSLAERYDRELQFWRACRDDLLAQDINLAAYNSAESAADVNDLRLALGYEQVNLYGISYGTTLALAVLRDAPEGIRSAIVDSIWPPQVNLDHDVAGNAHRALSAVFAACAADTRCSQAYPDLEATFYRVLQELNANPVTLQSSQGPVVVDGYDFLEAIFSLLYSINDIPTIPAIIDRAGSGEYEEWLFEVPELGNYAWGMHYSVRCHEELAFESAEEALALAAGLPTEFRDFFAGTYEYALCESWPAGTPAPQENEPVVSDVPTLALSGYYDPITPPAYGRLAAATLSHSYFYEFPTLSHGVARSNECALDIVLQFLDDPMREPDTSCMEQLTGPHFE